MVDFVKADYAVSERRAILVFIDSQRNISVSARFSCSGSDVRQVVEKSEKNSYWGYRKMASI